MTGRMHENVAPSALRDALLNRGTPFLGAGGVGVSMGGDTPLGTAFIGNDLSRGGRAEVDESDTMEVEGSGGGVFDPEGAGEGMKDSVMVGVGAALAALPKPKHDASLKVDISALEDALNEEEEGEDDDMGGEAGADGSEGGGEREEGSVIPLLPHRPTSQGENQRVMDGEDIQAAKAERRRKQHQEEWGGGGEDTTIINYYCCLLLRSFTFIFTLNNMMRGIVNVNPKEK